jgi:hypothetical protein
MTFLLAQTAVKKKPPGETEWLRQAAELPRILELVPKARLREVMAVFCHSRPAAAISTHS